MARFFDDALTQYLNITSAPITAVPLSMTCWFNTDDVGVNQGLTMMERDSSNYFFLMFDAPGELRAYIEAQGIPGYAASTAGPSVNTWHHAAAVYSASNSRAVYLDGGNKGTNADDLTPDAPTDVFIGTYRASTYYLSGRIAEVTLWKAALSDVEVWQLAQGVPPMLIRPESLIPYWPLMDNDNDVLERGYHLTAYNTPTWAAHPRRVMDWRRKYENRSGLIMPSRTWV